uniref:Aminotransferase-like plant mobile domain-containing protein n=1 Tax=Fagus sylvatica TaxID=28930 RepID=A0A2N9GTD2_FAGSY
MSDFDVLGTVGKLALPTFARFRISRESELGLVRYGPANRGHRGVFGPLEDIFPIGIPARPGKFLAIREFHVVHECVFFPTCPGLRINLLRVRKTLRASVATSVGKFRNFQHSLISSACFHALHRGELGFARYDLANRGRRNVPYAKGFDHNSLISRPFLARKAPNRSSHHALQNGQGVPSKLWEMCPGPHFEGFWTWWTLVGLETARSNLGQTWSTLVKLGQTSGNVSRTFFLGLFDVASPRRIRPAWFGLSRFACRHPRKSRGTPIDDQFSPTRPTGKHLSIPTFLFSFERLQIEWSNGLAFESKHVGEVNLRLQICPSLKLGGSTVWHLNPNTLRGDLTWGLPKLQIEWSNGLAFESKHVGEVNLRLQICPSLKLGGSTVWHLNPNTLRGDLTWGLPKLQIECICPTAWHLNPNTLRGDLTWGLPKLQIEWSNGLAFESKHVGEVNLRLQICPSLKLGGSTVWHLNPNTLRGDLTWGLPKLQIEWSNGLAFESKHVGEVNLRLQICPSLKLGGSTVWHLNPNTLRGDLTWGLPKLQIEWSNGLAFESKHVGEMSDRGSGSGGLRRSGRLAKGKAVAYEPESPPDTDDEYDAMEDVPYSARPSGAPRQPAAAPTVAPPARSKRQRSDHAHPSADPIPEDYIAPGFRYPPRGGIRPRYPVTTPDPPASIGRGGWSDFCQLLEIARPEYRDFLAELGFGPFPQHPLRSCVAPLGEVLGGEVLPSHGDLSILAPVRWGCFTVDWSAILGIRFGGRIPPSDPVPDFEALEILGIADPAAVVDRGASYGAAISPVDCLLSSSAASLGMTSLPFPHPFICSQQTSQRPSDSVFPLARRWDSAWIQRLTVRTLMECRTTVDCIRDADIVFQPYSSFLLERPEVFRAMELSRLRIWIRSPRSLGALDGREDLTAAGWQACPTRSGLSGVSLGPLMSLHEVEGGRVMGGSAMDSHLFQSSGEIERLENEILRLQLELSVSEDRHAADMGRMQGEVAHMQMEATQCDRAMAQMQADLLARPVFGQTSSTPPPDPVSRDWFFDDPPST